MTQTSKTCAGVDGLETVLSLSHVVFPSQKTGAFRVKVALTDGDLPMHLWLESKQSKAQWECLVKDTQKHVPKGATYVFPSKVVATTLQNGLSALAKVDETSGCNISLHHLKNGHVELVLTLTAFGCLEVSYSFDMMPVLIDKIDILEAKIRDLEESTSGKTSQPPVLSSNAPTGMNCFVSWTPQQNGSPKYLELAQDAQSMSVLKPGLYYIQFNGYLASLANGSGVRMLVDGTASASTPVHHDGYGYKASIAHTLIATEATVLKFQVYGAHNLNSGAVLSIARLQEF
ncbi:hypothetical protein LEN26_011683 [Aphanomyces euteiches]|nr:hypothetical protein AeMF1_011079 [Aphanomyces euteiches]KAH9119396.1 hypothetical protein LEN26_011683 [Aphanomyces euteiches]KAH9194982.1 hypothetical protein AeNC1_003055 [Aphanomyces euteiches]